jgi:hypothetical protein
MAELLEFDLGELAGPALFFQAFSAGIMEELLDDLADAARAKWIKIAGQRLHSTAQTYIEGIQPVQAEPGVRTISLVGWLPVKLEEGWEGMNLRLSLLGPNAKNRHPLLKTVVPGQPRVRVGWYANVPFRHGTPGSTGLAGMPMGEAYGPRGPQSKRIEWTVNTQHRPMSPERARAFGKDVYDALRSLEQVARSRGRKGPVSLPERMGGPLLARHHTTGIYTGMRRIRKPYANEKTGKTTMQSQYFTWRRISDVNPVGWIHPGFAAHRFSNEAMKHVEKIAPATINMLLMFAAKRAGKGGGTTP